MPVVFPDSKPGGTGPGMHRSGTAGGFRFLKMIILRGDHSARYLSSPVAGGQFQDTCVFSRIMAQPTSKTALPETLRSARAFAGGQPGAFDSRLLVIGQRSEVEKYLLWRQLDASANSLNMLASAHFSHEELDGRSTTEKHDLLHGKGMNWAKEPADFKRARAVVREGRKGSRVDREIPVFNRVPGYLEAALAPR